MLTTMPFLLSAILSVCMFNSTRCYDNKIPVFSLFNLDTSKPLRVQPDFSGVGKDLGNSVGNIFSQGARSFNAALNSKEYRDDVSEGMAGFAHSTGEGFKRFNKEAEETLFPEMGRSFRGLVGTTINAHNTFRFGGLIALSLAVSAAGYYGTKFLWEFITYKVLNPKPVISLPGTTYGWLDRVKRWWTGYSSPAMICDETVKERLSLIEEKTHKIRAHNKLRKNKHKQLTYDNLLLCGEPGTGKTLFARVLADRTNMDIVITTAASLLQSGVQGVKYINDIMRMARKSKYGLIIFVDEADALFVDRDSLNPDSDHYKLLSHLLALTGEGSSKFMLIAATNHAKVMDSAMGRRFQDRVDMPLPGLNTRTELITMYVRTLLDKKIQVMFTAERIALIADKVEGLSHAEIADMIRSFSKMDSDLVSYALIDITVENALNKKRKQEEELALREASLNAWRSQVQKMMTVIT